MKRTDLYNIIDTAALQAGCSPEERTRLVHSVDGIDRVLVGNFQTHIEGTQCGCPATLAGYFNPVEEEWVEGTSDAVQKFPNLFDRNPRLSRFSGNLKEDHYNEYIPVTD